MATLLGDLQEGGCGLSSLQAESFAFSLTPRVDAHNLFFITLTMSGSFYAFKHTLAFCGYIGYCENKKTVIQHKHILYANRALINVMFAYDLVVMQWQR